MNTNRRMVSLEVNRESLFDGANPDPNDPKLEVTRIVIRNTHDDFAVTMLPPSEIMDGQGKGIELIILAKKICKPEADSPNSARPQ